jgi:hypothetical protein
LVIFFFFFFYLDGLTRNQRESRWRAELGLFFDPEDGGDVFLRNVGWLSTDYTAYIPEDITLHDHRCENLRSYIRDWWWFVIFLSPLIQMPGQ